VWGDVYAEANQRNVVVVGGGDPVFFALALVLLRTDIVSERRLYWGLGTRRRTFSRVSELRYGGGSNSRGSGCACK
jgi:hypothetical protein